jgi:hypothetical protein
MNNPIEHLGVLADLGPSTPFVGVLTAGFVLACVLASVALLALPPALSRPRKTLTNKFILVGTFVSEHGLQGACTNNARMTDEDWGRRA